MKLATLALVASQILAASAGPVVKRRDHATSNTTNVSQEKTPAAVPFPVWNMNNVTCQDIDDRGSHHQWAMVRGDETVQQFEKMLDQNFLICTDCYGKAKDQCTSTNRNCDRGLADIAKELDTEAIVRWDTAVGVFSGMTIQCNIGHQNCGQSKTCEDSDGPSAWALAQSLSTMNNLYNNMYTAIGEAGSFANTQMKLFQGVFAPIPEPPDNSFAMGLLTAITSGIAGFVPGAGAAVTGLVVGIGNAILTEVTKEDPPKPTDPAGALGLIASSLQRTYQKLANSLFQTGRYTYASADGAKETNLTLAHLMSNGSSLVPGRVITAYENLESAYKTILFQQLAVYTWKNLQSDGKGHVPFIAFDPMPCGQVKANKDSLIHSTLRLSSALESSFEYKGFCYYLLDGTTPTEISGRVCQPRLLPGGNITSLNDHKTNFNLSIEDFIIPSVEGWLANNKDNAYSTASQDGKLVSDPRSPGAVNLPICDYKGSPSKPGVGCPEIGKSFGKDNKCQTFAAKTQNNVPGVSNPGWCQLHVDQFQRQERELNPTDFYQLEISVFDNFERKVGFATKQPAFAPLEVSGSLSYNLIVAAGGSDEEPLSFWYSDQFWTSDSQANLCKVGPYDGGKRSMDCGFQCPPKRDDPVSATEAHRLPAAPTKAVAGPSSFVNTFTTAEPTATPTGGPDPAPAPAPPTYAKGWCTFHMTQWQKWEKGRNEHGEYAIEMTIYDAEKKVIGASGKILTPDGQATLVRGGLEHYLLVTPGKVDADPFTLGYAGSEWRTDSDQCSNHDLQVYDGGKRELDCGFTC